MKFKLLILLILFCPSVYANDFICTDSGKVTGYLRSVGSASGCVEVPERYAIQVKDYFETHQLKYTKIVDGLPVEMSQVEKDAIDAEEAQAVADAEAARLKVIDDELVVTQTVTLTKVEQAIDNITNLADAKVFLKRLCRYLASKQ